MDSKNSIVIVGFAWRSMQNGAVYSTEGLAPTISRGGHSGVEPKIIVFYEV